MHNLPRKIEKYKLKTKDDTNFAKKMGERCRAKHLIEVAEKK